MDSVVSMKYKLEYFSWFAQWTCLPGWWTFAYAWINSLVIEYVMYIYHNFNEELVFSSHSALSRWCRITVNGRGISSSERNKYQIMAPYFLISPCLLHNTLGHCIHWPFKYNIRFIRFNKTKQYYYFSSALVTFVLGGHAPKSYHTSALELRGSIAITSKSITRHMQRQW